MKEIHSSKNSPRLGRLMAMAACSLLFSASLATAQPVINSIYPPVLTEKVGDHVAYVASASGSGTLTYQWFENGTPLTGQTAATLILTNIQPANSGSYTVVVGDTSGTVVSNSATLNVAPSYLTLYPTNIIVARLGDGAQTLSAATGNSLYLDQYTTNGTYVSTTLIPDSESPATYGAGSSGSSNGSPALVFNGAGVESSYESFLTLSGNQQSLTFIGYDLDYPYSGTDVTSSGGTGPSGNRWRGIGEVNAFGFYSLVYTNTGFYNGGTHAVRSATTSDGSTNFWTTGEGGSQGVRYINSTVTSYALGSGIPYIKPASLAHCRVVQIVGGNLVYSDTNIFAVAGLPEPAASGFSTASLLINENGQPNDFAFSPDGQTVYIADSQQFKGTSTQAGGVERWDTNSSGGGYTFSYTLAPLPGLTNGAQGLTVFFPPNVAAWGPGVTGASLYATTFGATTNSLVQINDTGAASTSTVLVTAGTNEALRGIRFGPSAVANIAILTQPVSVTNAVGNSATFSVVAFGSGPYFYQWQFNGANIAGANQSTLTVTNLQFSNAGNYTVIISNLVPSTVTSSPATLSVAAGAPVVLSDPQSLIESAGDHTAFAFALGGSTPMYFQWLFNGSPVAGATNFAIVLTNIQPSQSGTYSVQASNAYGTASASATLTVDSSVQTLSSSNLVVARIGEGAQALSGVTGNTLYLDQYTQTGVYVGTTQIPDEDVGHAYGSGSASSTNLSSASQSLIFAGAGNDASNAAFLTLSGDGETLNFAGYALAYPFTNLDNDVTAEPGNNGGNIWRGIGGIGSDGYYSLEYTNTGLYSGGNHSIRSAYTPDGVNFYTTGQAGSDGVKYVNITDTNYALGAGSGIPTIGSSGVGSEVVQSSDGNLIFSDYAASPPGIYDVSTLPQPATGNYPSQLVINEGGHPTDFAISPDGNTIYIADNGSFGGSTVQGGGIQRWDYTGANPSLPYVFSYTLATGTNSVGARGLEVNFPNITFGPGATGATLYATTAEASGNRLIEIVDNGSGSTPVTLATTSVNEALAGLRFGPSSSITPTVTYPPLNQTVILGATASFTVEARGGPFTYQWELNGTPLTNGPSASGTGAVISGAQSAILNIANVALADSGESYSVLVADSGSSTLSSSASLTVVYGKFNSTGALVVSPGSVQLNFSGSAGQSFRLWSTTNLALEPVIGKWKALETNTFSGGSDSFTDTTESTNVSVFYSITVP